jgi:gluconate kinase
MKVHEFERIVSKLGMESRNSYDRLVWLVHEGKTVVRTRRSHGKGKFLPADKIRQQLKVNEEQLSGLISCSVSKQDYIKILTEKGVIS